MEHIDRLKLLTAWDVEPVLTEDEIEAALATASLADVNGLEPLNEEWTPTYDLNAAAAQCWMIKAGRAASTVDEPAAGEATSKTFDNCLEMARSFGRKRNNSLRFG